MFARVCWSLIIACSAVAVVGQTDHVTVLQLQAPVEHVAVDHRRGAELTCDAQQHCHGTCVVDVYNGRDAAQFKMEVAENDVYVSRTALCEGSVWELGTALQVIEVLKQTRKGNFLDVGANIGSYSLTVASWMRENLTMRDRKVIAIEAGAVTADMLQLSVDLNAFSGFVDVHHLALVNDSAKRTLCLSGMSLDANRTNLGGAQADFGRPAVTACAQEVPATTLDGLHTTEPDMKDVVVAKLDCEGCEGQSLLGGRRFLREHAPCVLIMEVTEKYLCHAGTPLNELKAFLDEMGYEPMHSKTHGDGTCAGYEAWEARNGVSQRLEIIRQRHFDSCMKRFF